MSKEPSPSHKLAAKTLYAAFQVLKEKNGEAPGREIIIEIEKRINFSDWEKGILEKTGSVRWQSILQLFSIDCTKAGFIVKKKGTWYLTPEGEQASSFGEAHLFDAARCGYRKWVEARDATKIVQEEDSTVNGEMTIEATLDEMEQKATEGIKMYIQSMNAYEFQDLVAALLRGMGYYTPFIAPKGKDGGIDIIAYKDPLGTETPRIKVQIKHRPESTTPVSEVRQLMGLLQNGDVGLFISSGGFTSDAKSTARNAAVHLELIDMTRFIELWQDFYPKMIDELQAQLPLTPIYFLAPK
jgi:restriction system protein